VASVCSRIHVSLRNSTATARPGSRRESEPRYATVGSSRRTHGASWNRTYPSQPAGLGQRIERPPKQLEATVEGLARKVRPVHLAPPAKRHVLGKHRAEVGRERLQARMVPRHQPVGLHVEEEAPRGGPLDPASDGRGRGQGVVGRVHLDAVEEARIPPNARVGRHGGLWVKAARGDEGPIHPRGDADAQLGPARSGTTRPRSSGFTGLRLRRPQALSRPASGARRRSGTGTPRRTRRRRRPRPTRPGGRP